MGWSPVWGAVAATRAAGAAPASETWRSGGRWPPGASQAAGDGCGIIACAPCAQGAGERIGARFAGAGSTQGRSLPRVNSASKSNPGRRGASPGAFAAWRGGHSSLLVSFPRVNVGKHGHGRGGLVP